MKEIEDMYKTGLLSERAYNEVAKIVGNLQEQHEMDVYNAENKLDLANAHIDELEKALDLIAGYAKIEKAAEVANIINLVRK